LAHLNYKSFFEVLSVTNKNIIYSHGNIRSLCDHKRNLDDLQLKALKKANGLLGLTLVGNFISKESPSLDYFIKHIDKAVEVLGIDNVCLGLDFMDYLDDFPSSNTKEISKVTELDLLIERLRLRGYSDTDIKKITFDNFYNRYKGKVYEFKN
ncbi:MAG: membrane dipeptidase, partial [Bacilli bacterium]|nr:membrane dipeptidase [Bacilli bacterium]